MTIKEMEALTGITKQNIRFYEKEGLLDPERNPQNQYREYTEEDLAVLKRIKLYRKLDISIEDIKQMENGSLSLFSCMDRCISHAEKEMTRMTKIKEICTDLKEEKDSAALDVDGTLQKIARYEESGYEFQDINGDFLLPVNRKEIRQVNSLYLTCILWMWPLSLLLAFLYLKLGWGVSKMSVIIILTFSVILVYWAKKHHFPIKAHVKRKKLSLPLAALSLLAGFLIAPVMQELYLIGSMILPVTISLPEEAVKTGAALLILNAAANILFNEICYRGVFYDTYRGKNIIDALVLSALVNVLMCSTREAMAGNFAMFFCMGILYELTGSVYSPIIASASISVYTLIGYFITGNEAAFGPFYHISALNLAPWAILSALAVWQIFRLMSRFSGSRIEWKLEWEKRKDAGAYEDGNVTVLNPDLFKAAKKEWKKSCRLTDMRLLIGMGIMVFLMISSGR